MIGTARSALTTILGWARQLRAAGFRGVAFHVENYGGTSGRRGPDHEYPGRDTPYAEDLGRRQRVWRFTGYVIGDDYPSRRDALIQVCDQAGPGELVHPTIGTVQAVCRTCSWTEERERGRYCAFEFEFREAGALKEPSETTDPDSAVTSACEPVGTAAETSFLGSFSTAGGGAWLNTAAQSDIQNFAQTMQQLRLPAPLLPQGELGQTLAYVNRNAGALAASPTTLAGQVDRAFAAFTEAGTASTVVSAMLSYTAPARGENVKVESWAAPLGWHSTDLPPPTRRADNISPSSNSPIGWRCARSATP